MTAGARRLFDEPISETLSTTAGTFSPAPPASSGRPSPHRVLPREITAIEAERCGPYRDAFGLCTNCGLRGRVQRRCAGDDPARSRESVRAPHAQPWKWVPCPHACGYVGQPEVRPDVLYGLIPQLSPNQ
ncbi:hypothetical protein OHA03_30135 [Streptomyces sp. NBC_00154]|nr:hypothetical protein [Streptomyces sp. NBC_00154]